MKHLLLSSISAAMLLTGCGGGGNSSTDTPTTQTVTYQAIDGYLQFAEMYADRNGDYIASQDEYLGLTDATGSLTVNDESQFRILVKVIAGQTMDSDTGMASKNQTLVASPGSVYITPFSTLADLNNKTIDSLAQDLGVDAELLDSDFIAASDSNTKAKLIRTLARSKMPFIGETIQDSQANIDTIQLITENFATYLNENVTDFDGLTLGLDMNGDIYPKRKTDHYDISNMRIKWVNDQWDGITLCYGQATTDKLVFSNCNMTKMVIVDQETGQLMAYENFDNYSGQNSWYLDGEHIVIEANDDSVDIFDLEFNAIDAQVPSGVFYEQAHNFGSVVFGDYPEIENAISNGQLYPYPVQDDHANSDLKLYDPTGLVYRIQNDGELDTRDAPTKEHLAQLILSDYQLREDAKPVGESGVSVTWLGGSIFAVQIDIDGDPYVADLPSTWYTFDSANGEALYIGEFYDGKFYAGLDGTTVTHYSPVRTYKTFPPADMTNPDYNEIHHWRQFSLTDGSASGELLMTNERFNFGFQKQIHTDNGIFTWHNSCVNNVCKTELVNIR